MPARRPLSSSTTNAPMPFSAISLMASSTEVVGVTLYTAAWGLARRISATVFMQRLLLCFLLALRIVRWPVIACQRDDLIRAPVWAQRNHCKPARSVPSRASVASKQRQTHPHLNTALDITDVQRTAMQLHHFLDKVEPQTGALAPAAGAWQGVETLAQTRQGVIGDGLALVEQAQFDLPSTNLGVKADQPTGRSEIQGVIQQIGQRLTQQKGLTTRA